VLSVVPFRANHERAVVAGVLKCSVDLLIGKEPTSGVDILIGPAILQEHPKRLWLRLADARRERVAAAKIGKTSNETDDPAERIRTIPGCVERRDPPELDPASA